MRLLPDPEMNDLLLLQRIMRAPDYVDMVWSFRDRLNPPPIARRAPYPFQQFRSGKVLKLTKIASRASSLRSAGD